jgi:hypothetical protein
MRIEPAQLPSIERDPANTGRSVPDGQPPHPVSDPGGADQSRPGVSRSNSVPVPDKQSTPRNIAVSSTQLPQDEVKVQWDDRVVDQPVLVYRFVSKQSGALIVQVPSQEQINLERSIEADFRATATKAAIAAEAANLAANKGSEDL